MKFIRVQEDRFKYGDGLYDDLSALSLFDTNYVKDALAVSYKVETNVVNFYIE